MKTILNETKPINCLVRFFIWDNGEGSDGDLVECDEGEFEDCEYPIHYERHTVFANGCSQICLTKMPRG